MDVAGSETRGGGVLQALRDPVDERLNEARMIEELPHLVDLNLAGQLGLLERKGIVFAILAATRIRAVGAGADGEQFRESEPLRLAHRVGDVRLPVAVAPEHRQVDVAARQFGLERCLQRPVLLVDGADSAEGPVVVRHLFQALVGDSATSGDVAQKRDHIVLALGPTETRQQDGVVGHGNLDVLGTRRRRVGGAHDAVGDSHDSTSAISPTSTRRPV